jgi:hypothetical protein
MKFINKLTSNFNSRCEGVAIGIFNKHYGALHIGETHAIYRLDYHGNGAKLGDNVT